MKLLAFAFVVAVACALYGFISSQGVSFACGVIFGCLVYQIGYYAKHNDWITF